MARTTSQPKEENFNFRVPSDLKSAFKTAAELADRSAAQVIRDFMRAYVEREHDAVMSRTRSIIDRMAAAKKRGKTHEA